MVVSELRGEAGSVRRSREFRDIQSGSGKQQERGGDDDVDGRPSDGDQKFLPWDLRDRVELGDAAERIESYVRRADAKQARDQHMTELMRDDACKHRDDENEHLRRSRRSVREIAVEPNPGKQQEERDMDANGGAGEPAYGK